MASKLFDSKLFDSSCYFSKIKWFGLTSIFDSSLQYKFNYLIARKHQN